MNISSIAISRTERANILILAALISLVSVMNIFAVAVYSQSQSSNSGIYHMARPSLIPLGRLLSVFVFVFVFFGRKYIVSLVWSTLCFLPFLREFTAGYAAALADGEIFRTYPTHYVLYLIANPLDYFSAILIFLVVIWQASIVLRPFVFINRVQ